MHEEHEVGARARLPDEEVKPKEHKRKQKLQFDKEEKDGVSEEQQVDASSFSEKDVKAESADGKTGPSKRLSRLEEKSERANEKVEQAKEKLPTKKKIKKANSKRTKIKRRVGFKLHRPSLSQFRIPNSAFRILSVVAH